MQCNYRASHVLVDLGWVDLDLGSSPGWWATTVATYCPSRVVEHPKSKSTKPSPRGHGTPCKVKSLACMVNFDWTLELHRKRDSLWSLATYISSKTRSKLDWSKLSFLSSLGYFIYSCFYPCCCFSAFFSMYSRLI